MAAFTTTPTETEALQAWSKYAKSVWFKGLPKDAKMAFKKGYGWTEAKQGYPAVISNDGEWLITFKKDNNGEVMGYVTHTAYEGDRKMTVVNKIESFLNESDFAAKFPQNTSKYKSVRPIQFMQWWGDFRPGDRMDVYFTEDLISIVGTNSEGQFAGIKKELEITDPAEIDEFKSSEGRLWNFV